MNPSVKTQQKKEDNCPAIGNFVHYHILEHKIKKADLSRSLGIIPTSLNAYFKKDTLQTSTLWKLSQAMQHNFIAQLGEYLGIPYETKKEKALLQQLAEKEELIKKMEIQIEVYEKMVRK